MICIIYPTIVALLCPTLDVYLPRTRRNPARGIDPSMPSLSSRRYLVKRRNVSNDFVGWEGERLPVHSSCGGNTRRTGVSSNSKPRHANSNLVSRWILNIKNNVNQGGRQPVGSRFTSV